ncbi:hypothetical protein FRC07_006735 [Ceratobasidium sp. 392]|nr:hypothetical protein FRC07_006735 [Ceratobasidium sp. 392]
MAGNAINESEYTRVWLEHHYSDKDKTFVRVDRPVDREGTVLADLAWEWGIGPFTISASVNTDTWTISVEASVHLPIIGKKVLASVSGNLKDGVTLDLGYKGIASGEATVSLKNGKEVWIKLELESIVGNLGPGEYHMFDI